MKEHIFEPCIYFDNKIKCVKDNEIRTREDIHGEIYDIVYKEIQKK